jgi:hypothetical protein
MDEIFSEVNLPPLHGVELRTHPLNNAKNTTLPFHLNVTVNYDDIGQSNATPIWNMVDEGERYTSVVELYKQDSKFELSVQCEGSGTFTFDDNNMQVNWQSSGTGFEHYLQSLGLACWLELQGIPCIHANAITLDNEASLIIAPSRTGKSTLTTHLLGHGFKLMTDDMAAIHSVANGTYKIYPSWPKVRLWPDMANSLIGMEVDTQKPNEIEDDAAPAINKSKSENLLKFSALQRKHVHQKFAKYEIELATKNDIWETNSAPLKAIYYLERTEALDLECSIEPISASAGLMMLLQNSMLADAYTSMNVEMARLSHLAKLLNTIPIFKIRYASGLNNLNEVGIVLKKHIRSL